MSGSLVLLAFSMACLGQAQPAADVLAAERDAVQALYQRDAEGYEFFPSAFPNETFRLLKAPVLKWDNSVRETRVGSVYLWVDRAGQPGVIAAIFAWPARNPGYYDTCHECESLAAMPITAVWQKSLKKELEGSIPWRPLTLPVPSVPGNDGPQRAANVAALFTGYTLDRGGERWDLTLERKPLYTYETRDEKRSVQGALFALCSVGDPEVILCLEEHQSSVGPRWFYRCADFSDRSLHVSLADVKVWSVERYRPQKPAVLGRVLAAPQEAPAAPAAQPPQQAKSSKWCTKIWARRVPLDKP